MSNGDCYHRDSMTCAHLKFPLGTMLKVKNPKNGKEVVVKVTDRGPHTKRFMIDLSYAAARELGIIRAGFSMVEITPWHGNDVPYLPEKPEYDLPQFELTSPQYLRTWNHPAWEQAKEPAQDTPSNQKGAKEKSAKPSSKADIQEKQSHQVHKPTTKKAAHKTTEPANQPSDDSRQ